MAGDVLGGDIPQGLRLLVEDPFRFEPRMVVEDAGVHVDEARARGVLAEQPAAARGAEVSRVDVAAIGRDRKCLRLAADAHVLAAEARVRDVTGAGGALAILAVTLPHGGGRRCDGERDGPAQATAGAERFG